MKPVLSTERFPTCHWAGVFVFLLLLSDLGDSYAQSKSYPDHTIRLIVPNAAGGGTDAFARVIAQKLSAAWGQTVVVDNKPGAQGNLGTSLGAKALPDGYTLTIA